MPLWLDVVLLVVGIACFFVLVPWGWKVDKRIADRREAQGKPRSLAPKWVPFAVAASAIVIGIVLNNIP